MNSRILVEQKSKQEWAIVKREFTSTGYSRTRFNILCAALPSLPAALEKVPEAKRLVP